MPVYRIESKDDPRVAVFRDLPRARDRSGDGRFIAEGRMLVERLWQSPLVVESVFTDETHLDLAVANSGPETPVMVAPKQLLEETIGFRFHRGLLACGAADKARPLESQLNEWPDEAVVIVLDQVVDQENMGGIIRNAAALGATAVLVGPASAQPFSRRVLRVSMGAVLNLPPLASTDLAADLDLLKSAGFHVVAAMLSSGAVELQHAERRPRTAILFGNEGHGIDPRLSKRVDCQVTIPMRRGVDSLNVASASAIFIHHFMQ